MEIKHFTPAQTLMITKPIGVNGRDLMKYSFLDLVYRGILKVYREWRLPHPNDAQEQLYTFVSRGDRFQDYVGSLHQDPFVNPFEEDNYEYQVRTLVKKVFKEQGKASGFKLKRVYEELRINGYFASSYGLKYMKLFFLNETGSGLKKKFKQILEEAEKSLPKVLKYDKNETKEILSTLGSNILLLECFDDHMIKQLKSTFAEEEVLVKQSDEIMLDRLDTFEVLFYAFLDTIEYFDASFDSFDSSFDFGGSDFGGDFGGGDWGGGGDFGGGDF